jgi:uncharacterized membrane protein
MLRAKGVSLVQVNLHHVVTSANVSSTGFFFSIIVLVMQNCAAAHSIQVAQDAAEKYAVF